MPSHLWVGAFDDRERAFDVGEQHGDVLALARQQRLGIENALGKVARRVGLRWRRAERRLQLWRRPLEPGDRGEQLLAMTKGGNAELLEIVCGQRAQDLGVDIVRREHLGISAKPVALQPSADVHRTLYPRREECSGCGHGLRPALSETGPAASLRGRSANRLGISLEKSCSRSKEWAASSLRRSRARSMRVLALVLICASVA
jgi:hypothetical protein